MMCTRIDATASVTAWLAQRIHSSAAKTGCWLVCKHTLSPIERYRALHSTGVTALVTHCERHVRTVHLTCI